MAWTLQRLFSAASLDADIRGDADVTGLAYDPREVVRGDLFCCIPGERADGHDFAPDVVDAGASALVVERFLDLDVPQAKVAKTRDALGPLADTFFEHPSQQLTVAGVTGTNGKTTVTYLLESIAEDAGCTPGVVGTVSRRFKRAEFDAPRNTPESIDIQRLLKTMLDAGVDLVALEATSDGLHGGRLVGTTFETAGFTNLTQDHLNTHGTMDAYFEAKALLFARAYTSKAVINVGDAFGARLRERVGTTLDVITYGTKDSDIACMSLELDVDGSRATLRTPEGNVDIETHLVGGYNVDNCMCALGMALQCGFDLVQIEAGIRSLPRVPGRLERVDAGQPFLALVDYAHTPDALEHALGACRELATGRVIAVFGCGGDRDKGKRPQMGEASARLADLTIITSDNPRSEVPELIVADIVKGAEAAGGAYREIVDRREAIGAALDEAQEGDVVLVAGKGHEQGQQFTDKTIPFDDRTVVREHLEASTCRN